MEIGLLEMLKIKRYMTLNTYIEECKTDINELRSEFYNQSMNTRTTTDGASVYSVGFRADVEVVSFIDLITSKEKTLQMNIDRQNYFNKYLDSLSLKERTYLVDKYSNYLDAGDIEQLDRNTYDEILEITDAVYYRHGYDDDVRNVTTISMANDDVASNINDIAEMLGV